MTQDKITDAVTRIVSSQIDATHRDDRPNITESISLYDFGLDELSAVEIIMHIEEVFNIELADDDITLSSTISGIIKLVAWHLRNRMEHEGRAAELKAAWLDYPEDAA